MKRTAVVTGGAGGIGRAIVRKMLASGIRAVIVGASEAGPAFTRDCNEEFGESSAVFHRADISDHHQVSLLFRQLSEEFGAADYLVNNAVYSVYERFLDIEPESWQRVIQVGLSGTFFCSQAFAKQLVAAGKGGAIVNVASINSFAVEKGTAHYASLKGGMVQLTKSMAVELAEYGIKVNSVAPGMIETHKNRVVFREEPFISQIARIPLKRAGTPEEIANVIHFLLTEEHYMMGQTILADGGLLSGY